MRVTYDREVDAAYIYLIDISPKGVARTVRATSDINLDFDKDGRLIGIELLRESLLPTALLEIAEKPPRGLKDEG